MSVKQFRQRQDGGYTRQPPHKLPAIKRPIPVWVGGPRRTKKKGK